MIRPRIFAIAACAAASTVAALVDCGGDSVVTDAGADAPSAPDTGVADTGPGADAGADTAPADSGADTNPAACDRMKNFATPTPVKLQNNANPIVAQGFRVRGGIAYFQPQSTNKVQQGAYASATVSSPVDAFTPIFVAGFDVSADGLTFTESAGLAIARATRAATNVPFGAASIIGVTLPPLDASIQVWNQVSGTGATIYFARAENSQGAFAVDIFRATDVDAGAYATTNQTTLHGGIAYVGRPVPLDETRMYLTGWSGTAPIYQRLFVSTRASAQQPWATPVAVTVDGLTPQTGDQIVPLDVSADDCVLWYGIGTGVDGPYSVYEARRPK